MNEGFNLSKREKICNHTDYPYYEPDDVKEFIRLLKAKIKTISKHQIINGKANPEFIKYFAEGERKGRENERELALSIIDELVGEKLK